jgi:hypothetical protein
LNAGNDDLFQPKILFTTGSVANDDLLQPKSLLTTCFVVAAKNINNTTEFDRYAIGIKKPLIALSHAHHNEDFDQEAFKIAFNICVPPKIKSYFEENPKSFNNLCWIIKNDANNNINDTLILLANYYWTLVEDKIFFATALLSLGANINTLGTLKKVKNKTPLSEAIKTRKPYLVKFLLIHGADVNMKTNDKTPLEYAQSQYNSLWGSITNNMQIQTKRRIDNAEKIIAMLYDHGAKDTETYSAKKLGWHDRGCTLQ